jgi:hypothetical protein
MKETWNLLGVGGHPTRFITRGRAGRPMRSIGPVLTVTDLCRRLGKSRRQVYRFIHSGRLQPCGRVLDQWLFAPEEPAQCATRAVPRFLRPFLWDVRLADLSLDRHRDFILGRLLEYGGPTAMHWGLRTYSRKVVAEFLKHRGATVLSRRAWNFWAVQLGLNAARHVPAWRHHGRAWGGVE